MSHVSGADAGPASRPGLPSAPRAGGLVLACDITASGAKLSFTGELDMASADRAFCYVCDVIDRCRTAVVLDVAGLSFCDARGLAAFLRMRKYAEQAGTSLQLMSPSRQLREILRITGLAGQLQVTKGPAPPAIEWGGMCHEQFSGTGARRTHPAHA